MGWDSFGLPAEQYAIRTGTHPRETTKMNINAFRRQLQSMGYSYDWERECATSHPGFYKWTQWMFCLFHQKGLAYEAEVHVNYCPELQTVLANEEIENGLSKEGEHPVVLKPLKQWLLRITTYAERLIDDLDLLDWPEEIKSQQRFWIGKKEGAEVFFPVVGRKLSLNAFTTRPETLFGVSYIALSTCHPLADQLVHESRRGLLEGYRQECLASSRGQITSGLFLGAYAVNPADGGQVPIWVASYVLPHVGSGIVMGVPAHDENDYAFAKSNNLPIRIVVQGTAQEDSMPYVGIGSCLESSSEWLCLNGLTVSQARETVLKWLEEYDHGQKRTTYRLRDWLFSRQRYWGEPIPLLHFADGSTRTLTLDELPLLPPQLQSYRPPKTGLSPLESDPQWVFIQDPKTGLRARRETNTMPQWAGSCWYFLRFCDPRNEREFCSRLAQKAWMPVDTYIGGAEHAVLHLLYARFWHKILFDCGLVVDPEPFLKLKNPGMVLAPSFKKGGGAYVPVDQVDNYGKDYFLRGTKEKLSCQMEKMGKSKLNGVSPDDLMQDFGADALRLYVVFIAPLEKEKVWSQDGLSGCKRFLNRVFSFWVEGKIIDHPLEELTEFATVFARNFQGILKDYETWSFNTIVSKLMEIVNAAKKINLFPRICFEIFLKLLSPLAPHLTEEMWSLLGHVSLLCEQDFPSFGPFWAPFLKSEMVSVVVCVNGKTRTVFSCPKGSSQEFVLSLAQQEKSVLRSLQGAEVKRVVFVQDKVLNILVG
ncbi:Leucyl-tRNA synthetase [Candidatus Similichlamydia laticola]|uniref:Leucine--tRNA ligase n=2 Tax=Candidatus Similichlamydia laticola TaxID=2170265 RepID=A0A369KAA8_9BACT|nr:Leucyl-tRNA synthetase [Candidatus Similichlamydia laticola]